MSSQRITAPDDAALVELCDQLAELALELDRRPRWPAEQLQLCGEFGVYEWFIDPKWGGQGWNEEQIVQGYLALSAACITTTFILTQRTGACRRIEGCENEPLKHRLLPKLARGEMFGTVGISHLTTSRRHLAKPVLTAERVVRGSPDRVVRGSLPVVRGSPDPAPSGAVMRPATTCSGFRLHGMSPWVTGGAAADVVVLAATMMENGEATDEQLMMAVPTNLPGLTVAEPLPLVGVSASATGPVHLDQVEVPDEWLIAGPMRHVMASGVGASTGGLETSTLAIGLARAAIDYLSDEATRRADLEQPAAALQTEHARLVSDLLNAARGEPHLSKESIRKRANSLALRATQAALSAAKGSGYVIGHPAGRWCREAMFFLVWSCPQPVAAANLCELAGIQE